MTDFTVPDVLKLDATPRTVAPAAALPAMYEDFFDAWESLHSPSGEILSPDQIRRRKELAAQHLVGIAHNIRKARNGL